MKAGVWLLSPLVLLSACAGDAGVQASTVLTYDQCTSLAPGVSRVSYGEVAKLRGSHLITMPPDEDGSSGAAISAPAPGDAEALLLAISRGEQPTPGYGFTLEGAYRREQTAVVTVRWETPEPDSMQAQMLTHPCLVVALPRADFARVEVVDTAGAEVGSVDL